MNFDRFLLAFDRPKLKLWYRNLKFGQNKSCRGREDLQLLFWAKVDLRLWSGRKTRSNTAKLMFNTRTRLTLMTSLSSIISELNTWLAPRLTQGCYTTISEWHACILCNFCMFLCMLTLSFILNPLNNMTRKITFTFVKMNCNTPVLIKMLIMC